jgi:hypothetical protein
MSLATLNRPASNRATSDRPGPDLRDDPDGGSAASPPVPARPAPAVERVQSRQGDVLFTPVLDPAPLRGPVLAADGSGPETTWRYVAAADGRAHEVRGCTLWLMATRGGRGERLILRLAADGVATHPSHGPVALPAGDWMVHTQRQYVSGGGAVAAFD